MSDLFGNHIVGFPTRRLIYENVQKVKQHKNSTPKHKTIRTTTEVLEDHYVQRLPYLLKVSTQTLKGFHNASAHLRVHQLCRFVGFDMLGLDCFNLHVACFIHIVGCRIHL